MSQNKPSLKIPFQNIAGLPTRAQYEIRRNFEEVARNFVPGGSGYDAFIDPAAATNASKHTYKNITDFSVGETANLIPTHLTTVFVVGRPGTPVVETSNITLNGPVVFIGGGASGTTNFFATSNRPIIDFNGFHITTPGSVGWVSFVGLELTNTSVTAIGLVNGNCFLDNSLVNGISPLGAVSIVSVASVSMSARNSGFIGVAGFAAKVYAEDCFYQNATSTTFTISGGTFFWDGGSIDPGQALTFAISGNANTFIRTTVDTGILAGSTSFVPVFDISSTGRTYVNCDTLINYPIVTVGSGAGDCVIEGSWQSVTISGNTNNAVRVFTGTCVSGSIDVTGPCQVDAYVNASIGASRAICRGTGVRASFTFDLPSTNPNLALIACIDSLVLASYKPPATGGQAYTIDAASARCVLMLAGTTDAGFTIASTNAGTNCLVITETFAGGGGGAPSGPAGGSLGGTYPNPIFGGRDSSVDKINQDMLPAMLVEAVGPMGVQVYGHAVESALVQLTDLSGTWPNMQVTGLAGQKVTAASMTNEDILQYVTGFNVGWVNAKPDAVSRNFKDFTKDFMLMGG